MRSCFALLVLAYPSVQEEPRFSFVVEQGWTLTGRSERDFPIVQEASLQEGLTPMFKPPAPMPVFAARDRSNRPLPDEPRGPAPTPRSDPLKAEGMITVAADGACRLEFRRLEYWDRSQRYWIEFEGDKVRTVGLGGVQKWSGNRDQWAKRLENLEAAFFDAYLRLVTPQPAAPRPVALGLVPNVETAGNRLFVLCSVEEQIALLWLARIDGALVGPSLSPAGVARYPERPARMALRLVERLRAQADGRLAPRGRDGRPLRDEPWTGTELAVPTFEWADDPAGIRDLNRPVDEARARLGRLAAESRDLGMTDFVWRDAVETEARALRKSMPVAAPPGPAGFDRALPPRRMPSNGGTYDYAEKISVREERLESSKAEARAIFPELVVIHFRSGDNVWRVARVRLETWMKSELKRL